MIKAEEVLLTPNLARQWRERNTNNFRKINKDRVAVYASEIVSGNWKLNGEPIVFDDRGILVNGQHRIEAVIKAETPIRVLVVTGVRQDDCIFDSGLTRSVNQLLKAQNINMPNSKIAAINYVLNCSGKLRHGRGELIEYYKRHDIDFDLAYDIATRGKTSPYMAKAGCLAAVYCAIILDILPYESIVDFCKIVNSNMPLDGFLNEPAFALINTLNKIKNSGKHFMDACFNATWAALLRVKKQSRSTKKYNVENDLYITIINKVKEIEKMMTKGEAV